MNGIRELFRGKKESLKYVTTDWVFVVDDFLRITQSTRQSSHAILFSAKISARDGLAASPIARVVISSNCIPF